MKNWVPRKENEKLEKTKGNVFLDEHEYNVCGRRGRAASRDPICCTPTAHGSFDREKSQYVRDVETGLGARDEIQVMSDLVKSKCV